MCPFTVLPRAVLAGLSIAAFGLSAAVGGELDRDDAPGWRDPVAGASAQKARQVVSFREAARPSAVFKSAPALPAAADSTQQVQAGGSQALIGASCSLTDLPADVLSKINAARMAGGTCGAEKFDRAAALTWNERLFSAASGHSADMASRDYLDHVTPEGIDPVQRMEAAGYAWSRAGENLAAGNKSVEAVMTAWLKSDVHCRNVLNPAFTEVAVACVRDPASSYGTYWTMVLGRAENPAISRRSPAPGLYRARAQGPAAVAGAQPPVRP